MGQQTIVVENLFDGESLKARQKLVIDNGLIVSIENAEQENNALDGVLSAGFIDLQVNGGGGYLFNQSPDPDSLAQIAKAHQQFGTTGWLPTLITDELSVMARAADAVSKAILAEQNGILGIHFEGPHLSKPKRGVHNETIIRSISDSEMSLFLRRDLGIVMVTVAPENVSPEQIRELNQNGVIVSLGHSNASYEVACNAIEAGAMGFTHLYNAMSQLNSREPGMVGAALAHEDTFYGIILDGIHLHSAAAKIAYRANPNMVLVTDAMPPVGTERREFNLGTSKVIREGFKLTDEQGRLAGSVLDMNSAVNNAQSMLNIKSEQAIKLATINPAKFIGVNEYVGKIKAGMKASMVLRNQAGEIKACWVNGTQVV